jgi:hypothetical protein
VMMGQEPDPDAQARSIDDPALRRPNASATPADPVTQTCTDSRRPGQDSAQ